MSSPNDIHPTASEGAKRRGPYRGASLRAPSEAATAPTRESEVSARPYRERSERPLPPSVSEAAPTEARSAEA